MSTQKTIKKALDNAIQLVVQNKKNYVSNPAADFTRNRKLDMKKILNIILGMNGGSLNKELYDYAQITKQEFSKSAFVQQKAKILPSAFSDIFNAFNQNCNDNKTYNGYRLFAVDGTDLNISRNPDSKDTYITTKHFPEGYNILHINALYDLVNKTYFDCILSGKMVSDERVALYTMLERNNFKHKSIIIADRGYEAYNAIAHFSNTPNTDFVIRARNEYAIKPINSLPLCEVDVDVEAEITTSQTKEDKEKKRVFISTGSKKGKTNSPKTKISIWDFPSPYVLKYRVVRFPLETGEFETIVTSLPRDKFSIEDIKKLYHMRWGIETSFRELKYSIGLLHLHSKKDETIFQEIYAALIMYNYSERIATMAVVKQKDSYNHTYQLNFTMAFMICKDYFRRNISLDNILDDIGKYILPIRPDRTFKRKPVVKGFINFTYRIAA